MTLSNHLKPSLINPAGGDGVDYRLPNEFEQLLKQQALQTWVADRARLLLQHPFTASLALHLELVPVVDSRLMTAATDGRRVFFNPLFLQTLAADQRLFVLAHEVWHCAARHFDRQLGRDAHRWNLATDHEVNSLLLADGFVMPSNGVLFTELAWDRKNLIVSAEQVYEWLVQNPRKAKDQQGFDQHLPVDDQYGQEGEPWVMDPDFAPGVADAGLQREWQERLVATSLAQRNAGDQPGDIRRWLDQQIQPDVPWQQVLRQFVQRSYGGQRSWSRPSRRHLHRGLILPGMQSSGLRLVVALDVSGSTLDDLPRFVSELKALLLSFDRVELNLLQCDTRITSQLLLDSDQLHLLDKLKIHGGGGTSLIPPFERAASDAPDCLIYLTDGYGPAPANPPGFPVLWVLTSDSQVPANWGQTLFLDQNPREPHW